MAETVARVHTHTHTLGNLVNNKKESMISALLKVYMREMGRFISRFCVQKYYMFFNVLV